MDIHIKGAETVLVWKTEKEENIKYLQCLSKQRTKTWVGTGV